MSDPVIRPASTIEKITRYKIWVVVGVILVVALFFGRHIADGRKANTPVAEDPTISLTPGDDALKRVKLEKDLYNEQQKRAQMEQTLQQILAQQDSLKKQLEIQAESSKKLTDEMKHSMTKIAEQAVASTPTKMPPKPDGSVPPPPTMNGETPSFMGANTAQPAVTRSSGNYQAGMGTAPDPVIIIKPTNKSEWAKQQEVAANTKVSWKENRYAGYLVDGAFAEVNTLHGLDAGTSDYTRTNPQPIFFRVNKDAILPGGSNYSMKECFVLGVGYGDLSSERVYIQTSKISCVRKSDKKLLTAPLTGYVVDSDGVLGMRGKVISRKGALLYKSLLAGFAEGAAQILAASSSTTQISPATGVVTSTLDVDQAVESGLYNGVGVAAKRLAEVYIKEAEQIFPVINLPPGRKATLVISTGTQLKWESYDEPFVATASAPGAGTLVLQNASTTNNDTAGKGLKLPVAPTVEKH